MSAPAIQNLSPVPQNCKVKKVIYCQNHFLMPPKDECDDCEIVNSWGTVLAMPHGTRLPHGGPWILWLESLRLAYRDLTTQYWDVQDKRPNPHHPFLTKDQQWAQFKRSEDIIGANLVAARQQLARFIACLLHYHIILDNYVTVHDEDLGKTSEAEGWKKDYMRDL